MYEPEKSSLPKTDTTKIKKKKFFLFFIFLKIFNELKAIHAINNEPRTIP